MPLKLLCVGSDLGGGGAEKAQVVFLRYLNRAAFDANVFYFRRSGPFLPDLPGDVKVSFGVDKEGFYGLLDVIRIFVRLLRRVRGTDVVFCMIEGGCAYLCILAAMLARKSVILWLFIDWSQMLVDRSAWHRPISRWLFPRASKIICVSHGVANSLLRFAPGVQDRIVVVPLPVDVETVRAAAREEVTKATNNGLADWFDLPVLVAVGRLHRQKGFDVLLPAFRKLVDEGLDWKLLILGEGGERSKLEEQIRDLGIHERVAMPGFIMNPYPLIARAKLFVLSSRYEGLPTVLIEALALGLPVVATDCPSGPREILREQDSLVDPNDVCALARKLSAAMRQVDPAGSIALSERYSAGFVVPRMEEVFRSC